MEENTLQKMIQAARAGGIITKKYFGETLEIIPKSTAADFKTKADTESDEAIVSFLEEYFPHHNIQSEERKFIDKKSPYTFVIDPLDGTNNFVLGIPYFSTSVALMEGNIPVIAVVYNPLLEQVYWGKKGEGSFLNGKKLEVSRETDIEKATIATSVSYTATAQEKSFLATHIYMMKPKRRMAFWSMLLDLCLLASGKIEAIVNTNNELHDFIAGKLIAEEAGARITGFKGEIIPYTEGRYIISNGSKIHDRIVASLKDLML